jgi:hypothetical protein
MEANNIKCGVCGNTLQDNVKFCGKCGTKVEKQENITQINQVILNKDTKSKKSEEDGIGDIGITTMMVGGLRILAGFLLLGMLFLGKDAESFFSLKYHFSDVALNFVEGFIFIILGKRLLNNVNNNTKRYLWIVIIMSAILTILGLSLGGKPFLPGILLIYSIRSLNKLKKISIPNTPPPTYSIRGWRWLWVIIGSILILMTGILLDLSASTPIKEPVEIAIDKGAEYSQVTGNMYRNTKYGFRIKFPEGWKIEPGDGIHIVQKASFENSTIIIMVQQLDLVENEGFTSIKDAGSSKEFIDTVIEGAKSKFSDVKIINFGETKIDNEPAYWVEYSYSYEALNIKTKITNLSYFLAKGNTMYSITSGTTANEYEKMKPEFYKSVSTFVLENY